MSNPGVANSSNPNPVAVMTGVAMPQGDQLTASSDASVMREGAWSIAQGSLNTLVGDLVMKYWSHNVPISQTGNFLGRDAAGPCALITISEGLSGGAPKYTMWSAATGAAGTVPTFTQVYSVDMTNGFPTYSTTNAITAFAGGGQASAVQLTKVINRVTTVATAADSVKLPVATAGLTCTVINAAAANAMAVFPFSGDAINALAADTAISVASNKTIMFSCAVTGTWNSILTA